MTGTNLNLPLFPYFYPSVFTSFSVLSLFLIFYPFIYLYAIYYALLNELYFWTLSIVWCLKKLRNKIYIPKNHNTHVQNSSISWDTRRWIKSKSTIRSIPTHHRQNPTEIIYYALVSSSKMRGVICAATQGTCATVAVSVVRMWGYWTSTATTSSSCDSWLLLCPSIRGAVWAPRYDCFLGY
jgi:hypothetical protein